MNSRTVSAILIIIILLGAAGAIAFAMTNSHQKEQDQQNVFIVATDANEPVYTYVYGRNHQYAGIEMDILRAVSKEIGYKMKIVETPFSDILEGVKDGRYDVGADIITVTPERSEIYLYTTPYETTKLVAVVLTRNSVTDESELYDKTIGVIVDSTGESYVADNPYVMTPSTYATSEQLMTALYSDNIQCAIIDYASAQCLLPDYPDTVINDVLDSEIEEFAFLVNVEDSELRDKMNKALEKLTADGTVNAIKAYYYGSNGKLPPYYRD